MTIAIMRLPQVLSARGRSRSAHFLDIKKGLFTHPVKIGLRATGWPQSEVGILNAARIAGKDDQEIRSLVTQLESSRKNSLGGVQ